MIVKAVTAPLVRCGCVRPMNARAERFSKKCPVAGAIVTDVTKWGQRVIPDPTDNIFAITTEMNGVVPHPLILIVKKDPAMNMCVMHLAIRQPNMF